MARLRRFHSLGSPITHWQGSAIRAMQPYVIACAGATIALAVGLVTRPFDPDDSVPSLLFLAVVGLSAWHGGLGPALVATVLGGLAIDYYFETPRFALDISSSRTVVDIGAYLFVAVLAGLLHHRLRLNTLRLAAERDRAEAAVRARDDLIATVSHALRTPLTTIQMSLFTLRDESHQLRIVDRTALLTDIAAEANRLVHFVNDALALNRLENAPPVRREWNDAGEVVWAVLDRCHLQLDGHNVSFELPDDMPLTQFDAGLLDQALTALLENVATHTAPDTPVWVEGGVVGGALRICVSDAGPGIPSADRERIFAKYERLEEHRPGVGLGLTLARAALEAQGGQLWVEASEHGGARFVLQLPGAVASASPA